MSEFLKELGKHFLNLALLVAGALIVQPFVKGKLSLNIALLGVITYISFIILSFLLILWGNRLEERKREE